MLNFVKVVYFKIMCYNQMVKFYQYCVNIMKKTLKNLTIPFITLFLLNNPVLANDDEQVFSIKTEQTSNKNSVVFDDEQEDGKVIFNDSKKTSKKENKSTSKKTTNEQDDENENSEPQGDYISDDVIMNNMEATSATQYPFNDKINLNAKAQLIEYNVNLHNSDIKTPDLIIKNNQQVNLNIYKNWILYVFCLSVLIFILSVVKFFQDKKKHVEREEKK